MGLNVARFLPRDNWPTTVFAGLNPMVRNDRNAGALLFCPAGLTKYAWFQDWISPNYNGSGMVFTVNAIIDAAGDVTWGLAFERHQVGVTDLNLTTNFGAEVTAIMPVAAGGFERQLAFALTHAQLGSPQPNETFRARVRVTANAGGSALMTAGSLDNVS